MQRIVEPERPPIPFYLDHLNLNPRGEKHLSKEDQLLRLDEHGSKIG